MERRQDITLGLIFMSVGIAAAWIARGYDGASGTYPMVLGLLLTLLGGAVAVRAARSRTQTARVLVTARAQLVTAIAVAAAYVALIVPLGFYSASILLMLALPVALGFQRWAYAAAVAAIFVGIVWLVFSVLLEKPLPRELILSLPGQVG